MVKTFTFQAVINASVSVDTFFVLRYVFHHSNYVVTYVNTEYYHRQTEGEHKTSGDWLYDQIFGHNNIWLFHFHLATVGNLVETQVQGRY